MHLQWKKLSEELPEENRMILLGDHNFVDALHYHSNHREILKMQHSLIELQWAYFNPPEKIT